MRMAREEKAVRERLAQRPMARRPIDGMDETVRRVHPMVMAMAVPVDLREDQAELPKPMLTEPVQAIT